MSEEIKYPSKERERAKSYIRVSAEVKTYLHDLYNQIQYEFCEQYEDEIKCLQQRVEQLENIRKEAIEFINEWLFEAGGNGADMDYDTIVDLLNILNKGE